MANYSTRRGRPIGVSDQGFGGAGLNLGIEALAGEGDMITVFDDFNHVIPLDEFGATTGDADTSVLGDCGWVLSDIGAAANDSIGMNDVTRPRFDSCLHLTAGDTNDTGGNAQLDLVNADLVSGANHLTALSGRHNFPHLWMPDSGTATSFDNTTFVFACRIGLITSDAVGAWDGKCFIGFAEAGDAQIMTAATGVITIASTGALVGFHIPEDGSVDAVSHRTAATAMAEGTNFTELAAADSVDSTIANGVTTIGDPVWYDLAFRMNVTNMSDDNDNGFTTFYYRRIQPVTTATTNDAGPGRDVEPRVGEGYEPWIEHGTVLTDQTPNSATILVPTIEVQNGAIETADTEMLVDWWAMGISRASRY